MKKIGEFFKKIKTAISNFLFKNRYGTIMVLVGISIVFWDLFSKSITDGKSKTLIQNILSFFSVHNTGGAWSILSNSTVLLIVLSIIFIIGLFVLNLFLKQKNYFYAISMGLLFSGSLCNLYDRIKLGYVRDFIRLDFVRFPVFNLADIAIVVGCIMLAVYFIFIMPKMEKKVAGIVEDNMENNNTVTSNEQDNIQVEKPLNKSKSTKNNENIKNTNKTSKSQQNKKSKNAK